MSATTMPPPLAPQGWILYLLECVDTSYYAGITTDLERRFAQHRAGTGARYTRAHPPLRILGSMAFPDRPAASRAEHALKRLKRSEKRGYFDGVAGTQPDGAAAPATPGSPLGGGAPEKS